MIIRSILFFASVSFYCGVTCAQTAFPVVRHNVAPVYPPTAQAVRMTGDVNVRVEVNDQGDVISTEAISGHPLLKRSAEAAAAQWTFSSMPGRHFLLIRFLYKSGHAKTDKSALTGPYRFEVVPPEVKILQMIDYSTADK